MITDHRVQLQPSAKIRQVELEMYGVAGMKFSRKHQAEAALAQRDRTPWNRITSSLPNDRDISGNSQRKARHSTSVCNSTNWCLRGSGTHGFVAETAPPASSSAEGAIIKNSNRSRFIGLSIASPSLCIPSAKNSLVTWVKVIWIEGLRTRPRAPRDKSGLAPCVTLSAAQFAVPLIHRTSKDTKT